jgi:hypothetical protein
MAIDLTGITNHNEYYSQHYLLALFEGDLRDVLTRWEQDAADHPDSEAHRAPPARLPSETFARCSIMEGSQSSQ